MKTQTLFLICLFTVLNISAQDWNGIPVPADAGNGNTWQLQSLSDSFNYTANPTGKPAQFTNKWKDTFINGWLGPSLTEWNPGHVWVSGGVLGIQAHEKAGSNKILMGCMSSKETLRFPVFVEARVRQANCTLANNVWMLSADSTQEIDILETYPTDRPDQKYFDERIHLSHHVFIRSPFQDYQPRDEEGVTGTWYAESGRSTWRGDWIRIGVYWKNPWHLEYYINGRWVRTMNRNSFSYRDANGNTVNETRNFNVIDKFNYTNGTGLNKPQHLIINMEQQSWRTDGGITPTAADLNDANNRNIMGVDWIRVYKPVSGGGGNGGGGGGGNTGDAFVIQSAKSAKWVSPINGSSANGVAIVNHPNGSGNAREWRFVDKGNNYAEIKNVRSGRCIGVTGGNTANGGKIVQWNCNGNPDQQWRRVERDNGQFSFVNRNSGRCLDLAGGNTANNVQFHQWQCNANNQNQRFYILSPNRAFSSDNIAVDGGLAKIFTEGKQLGISNLQKGKIPVSIYNMTGQEVFNDVLNTGGDNVVINLSHLNSGVYMIKINSNVYKFIVGSN